MMNIDAWLGLSSTAFAFAGAVYWFRSSNVKAPNLYDTSQKEFDETLHSWARDSSKFNAWAALLTGVATLLGGPSILLRVLS